MMVLLHVLLRKRTVLLPCEKKIIKCFLIPFYFSFKFEIGFTGASGAVSKYLEKLRRGDEFKSFNDIYKLYSSPLSAFPIPDVRLLSEFCLLINKLWVICFKRMCADELRFNFACIWARKNLFASHRDFNFYQWSRFFRWSRWIVALLR